MAWYWYIPLTSCLFTLVIVLCLKEPTFYIDLFQDFLMQVRRAAQSLFAAFIIIPFLFICGGFIMIYQEWIEPHVIYEQEKRRRKKNAARSETSP